MGGPDGGGPDPFFVGFGVGVCSGFPPAAEWCEVVGRLTGLGAGGLVAGPEPPAGWTGRVDFACACWSAGRDERGFVGAVAGALGDGTATLAGGGEGEVLEP